ncbi:DUF1405 domain-containing protein [Saliphagus infecundisoli]|uniref:DUF1405 domain-containing protein n=1 Tax=Saliphagus infecundisoli TaxID=1849069 RepID=A0ABD5QHV0_9EURY
MIVPTPTQSARLPTYLAPLPQRIEDIALRYAWVIVAINLAGTVFGFWYYRFQFAQTPLMMWPVVPDSPVATLFMALSLTAWKLDYTQEWLHAFAFYGNIKLGIWTTYVQLVLNGPEGISPWLYVFLVVSHLAMALQAFVIYRYATFPIRAVAAATIWYGFNDLVDYFIPLAGNYHHTFLWAELVGTTLDHSLRAHDLAAAAAVALTLAATFLALATRVKKVQIQRSSTSPEENPTTGIPDGGFES